MLWFAAMNYTVHSIMYFYFGLTQCGPKGRQFAKKFAMLITTLQLTQMVFGIAVTVSSVVYHMKGHTCYVSLVNSTFGLLMYTSYFVLFLQLFLNQPELRSLLAGINPIISPPRKQRRGPRVSRPIPGFPVPLAG